MTYALIRYYITALGQSGAVWEKVGDPNPEAIPDFLSPREAKDIIKKEGMIKVHTYKDGEIWDFPDLRWTRKWKGIFRKRKDERNEAAKMRAIKKASQSYN